ncbi:hypothetical protein B0H16DRAFT_1271426, partial [Mycena metata]
IPVIKDSGQRSGQSMEAFFEACARHREKSIAAEKSQRKQQRLDREKNAAHQKECPGKGARVYVWKKNEQTNGHWVRYLVMGEDKREAWDDHSPSQRRFESTRNRPHGEWDLC